MHFQGLVLAAALALTALANPTSLAPPAPIDDSNTTTTTALLTARDPAPNRKAPNTFRINVLNKCRWTKQVALYQITPDFKMVQKSRPRNIRKGQTITIQAPYKALGMRLSGHAEWGTAGQWRPQALFEFGHSVYKGKEGTAYNLSVMEGSDGDVGIGAYPIGRDARCPAKTCFPWDCPASQGWRRPEQVKDGSPADTVCYLGKTAFKVVFCP